MLLKSLSITSKNGLIRKVDFRKGLNLVIDETTKKETESGNNVGKTTMLRVIDFCFGSSGVDIYTDPEFKTTNSKVQKFLFDEDITVELILFHNKKEILLRRNFNNNLFQVNKDLFANLKEYKIKIEKTIFLISSSKPSIREIMPKFIRKDNLTMSNALKFLYATTTKDQYEVIILYLFGFEDQGLLVSRFKTIKEISKSKKRLSALQEGKRSISGIKQLLKVIENNIAILEEQIKNFNISPTYEKEVNKLNEIKTQIGEITSEIASLNVRKSLNQSSLNDLQESHSSIDPNVIKSLYEEARILIPDLQKKFEEVFEFHNLMINRKIDYIKNNLKDTLFQIEFKSGTLRMLLEEEANVLKSLSESGSFSELNKLQQELNQLYERKGQESKVIQLVEDESSKLETLEKSLEVQNNKITEYMQNLDSRLLVFNKYLSEYSKRLYDEQYVLLYEQKDGKLEFILDTLTGNVGGGKKKGQITAFDFAYISFLAEMKSRLPRFVLHDSTEDVHINQLRTAFEIADSLDGQYIVSILRDKLTTFSNDYLKAHEVLSLSENDKFFRLS